MSSIALATSAILLLNGAATANTADAAPGPRFPLPSLGSLLQEEVEEPEDKGWTGFIEAGVSASGGNTKRFDAETKIQAKREWERNSVAVYGRAEYGEAEQTMTFTDPNGVITRSTTTERNVNRQTAGGRFDHELDDIWYLFAKEDLTRDEFKDIKIRSETFGGAGRDLYKSERSLLTAEVGIGYSYTSFYDEGRERGVSGLLGEKYETRLNAQWELVQTLDFVSNLQEIDDDFRSTFVVEVRSDLTETVYLSFGFEHRYDSEPARDNNGDRSDRQDYKVTVKLGYRF
jgi:putative salt-induced outer membrane protein